MFSPSIDAFENGNCADRVDGRLGDERRVGQLGAGGLVLGLLLLAQLVDAAEVHFVRRVHVRRCVDAHHHVLGDLLAHHAHLLDAHALARLERRAAARCGGARGRRRRATPTWPPRRRCRRSSMNARMSFFVTRPEMPVPFSCVMSTPCSFAILRTSGDERVRRRSSSVAVGGFGRHGRGPTRGQRVAAARRAAPTPQARRDRRDPRTCRTCGQPPPSRPAAPITRDDAVDRNRLAFLDA